jgi:AcrR family transcriptional regulator
MQVGSQPLGRRPSRKGELTARRILDAAEALFARRGFAGTALRDVARAAGIRTPSLYNHFDSKESLYAAVLERGLRPVFEALAGFVAEGESGERGRELVERVLALLSERPNLPRLVQYEVLTGGEHLSPLLGDWIGPLLARAQELVRLSTAGERWRPEEVPLLVLALFHAVIGSFTIAPFYRDLAGTDLLAPGSRALHTRFFERFVEALLPDAGAPEVH